MLQRRSKHPASLGEVEGRDHMTVSSTPTGPANSPSGLKACGRWFLASSSVKWDYKTSYLRGVICEDQKKQRAHLCLVLSRRSVLASCSPPPLIKLGSSHVPGILGAGPRVVGWRWKGFHSQTLAGVSSEAGLQSPQLFLMQMLC